MKAGLSRLVGTIETMKENLNNQEEEYEYVWEYEDDDSAEELEEDELPEAVVADVRREEATVAAEQAQLAQWRSELEGILKDRAERGHYFKDYANESQQRYERMLQSARDQLAGIDPRSREIAELAEREADESTTAAELEAEPEPIAQPVDIADYKAPSLDLLDKADAESVTLVTPEALEAQKNTLQDTLDSFAVDAYVYDALIGTDGIRKTTILRNTASGPLEYNWNLTPSCNLLISLYISSCSFA